MLFKVFKWSSKAVYENQFIYQVPVIFPLFCVLINPVSTSKQIFFFFFVGKEKLPVLVTRNHYLIGLGLVKIKATFIKRFKSVCLFEPICILLKKTPNKF